MSSLSLGDGAQAPDPQGASAATAADGALPAQPAPPPAVSSGVAPDQFLQLFQDALGRATAERPTTPKARKPDPFTGKVKETENFITSMESFMSLYPAAYSDDRTKITFLSTYLAGNALNWWRGLIQKNLNAVKTTRAATIAATAPNAETAVAAVQATDSTPDTVEAGVSVPYVIPELLTLAGFYRALRSSYGDPELCHRRSAARLA